MANPNPHTVARQTMAVLIREARAAGWVRIKGELKPDGSVTVDATMVNPDAGDDFLNTDLRMTK